MHKETTLESVKDYVGTFVIFDTGFIDNTIEVFEQFCKENDITLFLKQGWVKPDIFLFFSLVNLLYTVLISNEMIFFVISFLSTIMESFLTKVNKLKIRFYRSYHKDNYNITNHVLDEIRKFPDNLQIYATCHNYTFCFANVTEESLQMVFKLYHILTRPSLPSLREFCFEDVGAGYLEEISPQDAFNYWEIHIPNEYDIYLQRQRCAMCQELSFPCCEGGSHIIEINNVEKHMCCSCNIQYDTLEKQRCCVCFKKSFPCCDQLAHWLKPHEALICCCCLDEKSKELVDPFSSHLETFDCKI